VKIEAKEQSQAQKADENKPNSFHKKTPPDPINEGYEQQYRNLVGARCQILFWPTGC
jgi:hypothetical protein